MLPAYFCHVPFMKISTSCLWNSMKVTFLKSNPFRFQETLISFNMTPPHRPLNTLSAIPWLPDIFYNDPTPSTTQYIVSYTVITWHLLQWPTPSTIQYIVSYAVITWHLLQRPHRPLNTLSAIPLLPDIFYNDPTPSTTQYIVSYTVITWYLLQRPHPMDHSIHCQLYRDYLTYCGIGQIYRNDRWKTGLW